MTDRSIRTQIFAVIAVLAVVESVGQRAHRLAQREERGIEPRLGETLLAHPHDRLLIQPAVADEAEELLGRLQGILDQLFVARAAEPVRSATPNPGS